MSRLPHVIYTPDRGLGWGPRIWLDMARSLVAGRQLVWRLFVRDFSAKYRQSVLGYVWALLPTILIVGSFVYLRRAQVVPIPETDVPYGVYVLLGLAVWQLFAGGLLVTAQSLTAAGNFVTKIDFARETLVVAAFGQAVLDFMLRALLAGAALAWFGIAPSWAAVLVPMALVPLALMTLGFGFLLAPLNGVFRDTANAVVLVTTFGMFLAPVVYPPPTRWPATLVNYLNPASPFIIATRDLVFRGTLSHPVTLVLASCMGVIIFLLAWRAFHVAMPRIIERV